MSEKIETVPCAYCKAGRARRPSWAQRSKPMCGDCYMDAVKKEDPILHDIIAQNVPGYEHRRTRGDD